MLVMPTLSRNKLENTALTSDELHMEDHVSEKKYTV
jgi:hypothetical protein